jgi:hypothetical protein
MLFRNQPFGCKWVSLYRGPIEAPVPNAVPTVTNLGHPIRAPPLVPIVEQFPAPTVATVHAKTEPIEALSARVPLFRGCPSRKASVNPNALPTEAMPQGCTS